MKSTNDMTIKEINEMIFKAIDTFDSSLEKGNLSKEDIENFRIDMADENNAEKNSDFKELTEYAKENSDVCKNLEINLLLDSEGNEKEPVEVTHTETIEKTPVTATETSKIENESEKDNVAPKTRKEQIEEYKHLSRKEKEERLEQNRLEVINNNKDIVDIRNDISQMLEKNGVVYDKDKPEVTAKTVIEYNVDKAALVEQYNETIKGTALENQKLSYDENTGKVSIDYKNEKVEVSTRDLVGSTDTFMISTSDKLFDNADKSAYSFLTVTENGDISLCNIEGKEIDRSERAEMLVEWVRDNISTDKETDTDTITITRNIDGVEVTQSFQISIEDLENSKVELNSYFSQHEKEENQKFELSNNDIEYLKEKCGQLEAKTEQIDAVFGKITNDIEKYDVHIPKAQSYSTRNTFDAFKQVSVLIEANKNGVEVDGVVPDKFDVVLAIGKAMRTNILETMIIEAVGSAVESHRNHKIENEANAVENLSDNNIENSETEAEKDSSVEAENTTSSDNETEVENSTVDGTDNKENDVEVNSDNEEATTDNASSEIESTESNNSDVENTIESEDVVTETNSDIEENNNVEASIETETTEETITEADNTESNIEASIDDNDNTEKVVPAFEEAGEVEISGIEIPPMEQLEQIFTDVLNEKDMSFEETLMANEDVIDFIAEQELDGNNDVVETAFVNAYANEVDNGNVDETTVKSAVESVVVSSENGWDGVADTLSTVKEIATEQGVDTEQIVGAFVDNYEEKETFENSYEGDNDIELPVELDIQGFVDNYDTEQPIEDVDNSEVEQMLEDYEKVAEVDSYEDYETEDIES